MARFRRTTVSNLIASSAIAERVLDRIVDLSEKAADEFEAAAADGIALAERRAHLAEALEAEAAIDAATLELAGALILGGASAHQVASRTGISTATITRRVPRAITRLRGHELVEDPADPYGWRMV